MPAKIDKKGTQKIGAKKYEKRAPNGAEIDPKRHPKGEQKRRRKRSRKRDPKKR